MNNKKHKVLASATVMSLLISTVATVTPVKAAEVNRLGGQTREITAVEVAKEVFGKAETVVVVNGYGYADAVSATPLAKKLGAPILLTNRNGNDVDVQAIKDLGAKNVYIIGGTGAVSSSLEAKLDKDYSVTRIAGQDRYETNANVAKEVIKLTGSKEAVLVSAEGYADALSVASIAAAKGMPVLFGNSKEVPAAVRTVANGLTIKAVGGTGVLPESVLKSVNAERITKNAKDRFETNLEVLNYYKDELAGVKKVYMTSGGHSGQNDEFADALVASAAAAKDGAPVVLTGLGANSTQKEAANKYVVDRMDKDTDVKLVGGEAVLPDSDVKAVSDKKDELNKPEEVKELKVESVSAVNARTMEIKFTQPVDENTILDANGHFLASKVIVGSTDLNSATTAGNDYVGSFDDNKQVLTIKNKTASQWVKDTEYVVAIDGVKNAAAKAVPKYAAVVKMAETTAPTINSVTAVTNQDKTKAVTIEFSEPVSFNSVKVNGKFAAASSAEATFTNKYTLTSTDELEAGKTYSIEINGVKDLLGNSMDNVVTTSVTVVKDTTKSVATLAAKSETTFDIVFNKEMNASSVDVTSVKVTKNVNGTDVTVPLAGLPTRNTDKKSFRVTLAGVPFGSDETSKELKVTVKGIKDTIGTGNVMEDYTGTITLSKDTVKPSITSVVQKPGEYNKLNVTFSEFAKLADSQTLLENATNAQMYAAFRLTDVNGNVVKDASGNEIKVLGKDNIANAAIALNSDYMTTLTLSAALPETGSYKLVAIQQSLIDTASSANKNDAQVAVFNYTKQVASIPQLSASILAKVSASGSATTSATADRIITITFDQADVVNGIDTATGTYKVGAANNPLNYTVDGSQLPEGAVVTFVDNDVTNNNKDTVKIDFSGITDTKKLPSALVNGGTLSVGVSNVKTEAGSTVNYTTQGLTIVDKTNPTIKEAYLTGNATNGYTLTVIFSEDMSAADPTELSLEEGSNKYTFAGKTATQDTDNKKKFTISLAADDLSSLTLANALTLKVPTAGTSTKDKADPSNGLAADTTGITVVNYAQ